MDVASQGFWRSRINWDCVNGCQAVGLLGICLVSAPSSGAAAGPSRIEIR